MAFFQLLVLSRKLCFRSDNSEVRAKGKCILFAYVTSKLWLLGFAISINHVWNIVNGTATTTELPTTVTETPTTEAEAPTTETEAPTTEAEVPTTEAEEPTTEAEEPTTETEVPTEVATTIHKV